MSYLFFEEIKTHKYGEDFDKVRISVDTSDYPVALTATDVHGDRHAMAFIDDPHALLDLVTRAVEAYDKLVAEQEAEADARAEAEREQAKEDFLNRMAMRDGSHHPECSCGLCIYGLEALPPNEY